MPPVPPQRGTTARRPRSPSQHRLPESARDTIAKAGTKYLGSKLKALSKCKLKSPAEPGRIS
jgi:hypothetical protein